MTDDYADLAQAAARRTVPVPEAVITELRRLRAEMDARFARLHGDAPAPHAPLVLLYDETHDAFELPIDPATRDAVAGALAKGSRVNMRPIPADLPDAAPVLGRVRAAADTIRVNSERRQAEADQRRRAVEQAKHEKEAAEAVTAAVLAWRNLFRPDADAPPLQWRGYPSTNERRGLGRPLAVAHLGQNVFVLYEPGRDGGHLYTLAPCPCAANRYRADTLHSAATLSHVLDQILGEAPECAETCARWNNL